MGWGKLGKNSLRMKRFRINKSLWNKKITSFCRFLINSSFSLLLCIASIQACLIALLLSSRGQFLFQWFHGHFYLSELLGWYITLMKTVISHIKLRISEKRWPFPVTAFRSTTSWAACLLRLSRQFAAYPLFFSVLLRCLIAITVSRL